MTYQSTGSIAPPSIQFDQVFTTPFSSFNQNTNSLSTEKTGLYWMHMAIDVPPNVSCDAYLSSPIKTLSLVKSYPLSDKDTMSRDAIIRMQSGVDMTMKSRFQFQTAYWAGFRIDTMMNPFVCFYVGRSTSYNKTGQITDFDQVLVNEGFGWNSTRSAFIAPRSGIYFFSFSVGLSSWQYAVVKLQVNGGTVMTSYSGVASLIPSSGGFIYNNLYFYITIFLFFLAIVRYIRYIRQ